MRRGLVYEVALGELARLLEDRAHACALLPWQVHLALHEGVELL